MKASRHSRRWLNSLFVVTFSGLMLSVSCAQPSTAPTGVALTSPSAFSASGTEAKPGSSYDASGTWSGVISGDLNGSGTLTLAQDSHGNISGTDDGGHVYTFKHLGPGSYKLSVVSPEPCPTDLSGSAQLDTVTNTIVAHISGIAECLPNIVNLTITITKP